ncbi:MAG: formyltetrahydrofolate deformylase [Wenzhouxiangella sp.]|nr:formyltetrahydrofolate deformylase [Wenzhouxiangella sp.]
MNATPTQAEPCVLRVACDDQPGLITGITGLIYRLGGNIVENGEFVDPAQARFFMRAAITGLDDDAGLRQGLGELLPAGAEIDLDRKPRKSVVILATRELHCLGDLLIRAVSDDLPMQVNAVIANHPDLGDFVRALDIPFHCVSHEGISRQAHEARIAELIDGHQPDIVVLAKYMRIFSPEFVRRYRGRLLNIHHSFLPAFIGASPYEQAWKRGVKIIGATAHFATEDLDEGPIIAQDVVPVSHTHGPAEMARSGRDVEKRVLARALRIVLERRYFVIDNKTIIFD